MPEAKPAGSALPVYDLACPYCGHARELPGGHKVPTDTCCYPRMLSQLGWMVVFLQRERVDMQERNEIRAQAANIRRLLRQATREDIERSLQLIAQVAGARSNVYRQAYDVARSLLARHGGGAE